MPAWIDDGSDIQQRVESSPAIFFASTCILTYIAAGDFKLMPDCQILATKATQTKVCCGGPQTGFGRRTAGRRKKGSDQAMKMFKTFLATILTGFVLAGMAGGVAAAESERILTEKDWEAYTYKDDGGRTCYITSVPTKSKGKYDPANRGEIRVFVSHGPGKEVRNVVQFLAGYKHKKHSAVDVSIDGKKFKLFTIEGRAYAESEEDDVAMVRAMKRGSKMTVVGTSTRGTVTTDTYSLSGFTKTKNMIDKTCK